jgi:phospholipid/cholesterol/gamma-HCH transport system substrate-binding protein
MSENNVLANLTSWLRSPFGIGTIVLVLFGGAVVFGLNATHGMPLVERRVVKVAFEDLSGLNTGDDVRIAGSRVGYVDDLRLEDGRAVAVLKLDDPDTELYQNAHAAKVSDRSGLGQKFVNLDPGDPSTGPIRSDATIPARQTTKSEDLSQLLDVFDEKTRTEASVQLRNLGGGMIGHGQDLHAFVRNAEGLLEDTGTVSGALAADGGAPLEDLLQSADLLSGRVAARSQELAALVDQFATTVDAFAVDSGDPVREALERAPKTLEAARAALRSLNRPLADTAVAMRRLRPGAAALGRSVPDLRGFLRDAVNPLDKVPGVNQDAEPGVHSLAGLVEDARPLVTQLVTTGRSSAPFVSVLGDYAFDIANFYTDASGALSHGDSAGHWLRILLLPAAESLAGSPGPVQRDPYPEPIRN